MERRSWRRLTISPVDQTKNDHPSSPRIMCFLHTFCGVFPVFICLFEDSIRVEFSCCALPAPFKKCQKTHQQRRNILGRHKPIQAGTEKWKMEKNGPYFFERISCLLQMQLIAKRLVILVRLPSLKPTVRPEDDSGPFEAFRPIFMDELLVSGEKLSLDE